MATEAAVEGKGREKAPETQLVGEYERRYGHLK